MYSEELNGVHTAWDTSVSQAWENFLKFSREAKLPKFSKL